MRACSFLGASMSDPLTAAAVLRAFAARCGVPLVPADQVSAADLAAAVVAADIWVHVTGVDRLDSARGLGRDAIASLSNALARACGRRVGASVSAADCPIDDAGLALVEELWAWAQAQVGDDAGAVFVRAASDLNVDGPSGRFSRLSGLLVTVADAHAFDAASL